MADPIIQTLTSAPDPLEAILGSINFLSNLITAIGGIAAVGFIISLRTWWLARKRDIMLKEIQADIKRIRNKLKAK